MGMLIHRHTNADIKVKEEATKVSSEPVEAEVEEKPKKATKKK